MQAQNQNKITFRKTKFVKRVKLKQRKGALLPTSQHPEIDSNSSIHKNMQFADVIIKAPALI